jgi:hypothetical protein
MQPENYYRLRQIDQDGKVNYSKIVLLKDEHTRETGSTAELFTVFPNPLTRDGNLVIVFGEQPRGKVQVRLLDMSGREMYRQLITASDNKSLTVNLPASSLSAGVYLLEVRFNNVLQVQKIIKK